MTDWWQQGDPIPTHRVWNGVFCELGRALGVLEDALEWETVWNKDDTFGERICSSRTTFRQLVQTCCSYPSSSSSFVPKEHTQNSSDEKTKDWNEWFPWLQEIWHRVQELSVSHSSESSGGFENNTSHAEAKEASTPSDGYSSSWTMECTLPVSLLEHFLWPQSKPYGSVSAETPRLPRWIRVVATPIRSQTAAEEMVSLRTSMWLQQQYPRLGYIVYASWNLWGRIRLWFGEACTPISSNNAHEHSDVLFRLEQAIVSRAKRPHYQVWFSTEWIPVEQYVLSWSLSTPPPLGLLAFPSHTSEATGGFLPLDVRLRYVLPTSFRLQVDEWNLPHALPKEMQLVTYEDACRKMFADETGFSYEWITTPILNQ